MEKNNYSGKFIVFDGLDGSGQSSQAKLLKDFLISRNHEAILTKEPTPDCEAGREIRRILRKESHATAERLQQLFVEDRQDHLEKLIIPTLKEGKMVISDRYFFSTVCFGASDGLDLEWLINLNSNFLLPNLIFFLEVKPEICIQRIEKRGSLRELFEEKEKLAKVWQFYKMMPNRFDNIHILDGERPIETIFNEIEDIVISKLKL